MTPGPPHSEEALAAAPAPDAALARKQIRGSGLLLMGRGFAILAKLCAQVLVVRYLTVAEYGTWAYVLAAVAFLGGFAHLSLDRSVTRFAAIYHQRGQLDRFFGVIVLVVGVIVVTGAAFVSGLYLFPDQFERLVGGSTEPLELLFVMIFIVPVEALDGLLVAIIASFGKSRAIFYRRYVVTPGVQLAVVGLLVLLGADVMFLAYGYLAGAVLGAIVSGWLLIGILRAKGMLTRKNLLQVRLPVREVALFSAPLMTSDWLSSIVHSSGPLLLGYFHAPEQVAILRTIVPIAVLNELALQSFAILYEPNASRLYARDDLAGIHDLYWRTALWVAVLSFPVFALTFAAATPISVLAFGAPYEASGPLLAVLAVGYYVQAAMGFNGKTIKVVGRVGWLVWINLAAAVLNIGLMLVLIPRYGAMGAAIAISATMIAHNVFKQIGVGRALGFVAFDRRYAVSFAVIGAAMVALAGARLLGTPAPALVTMAIVACVLVFLRTRRSLGIGEMFPEIARVPILRGLAT